MSELTISTYHIHQAERKELALHTSVLGHQGHTWFRFIISVRDLLDDVRLMRGTRLFRHRVTLIVKRAG